MLFRSAAAHSSNNDVPELSLTSPTAPGVKHHWVKLKALVDEVLEARIWAGFHHCFSTRDGIAMGQKVRAYVAKSLMQPTALVGAR